MPDDHGHTEWCSVNLDLAHPRSSRVCDLLLGGKDSFAADRAVVEGLQERFPEIRRVATSNRNFVVRTVQFLVGELGLRQLIDLGAGYPAARNVHEVAQGMDPRVRVAYVDRDPIVVVHGRALLAVNPETVMIAADLREPEVLIPDLRRYIDFSEPVGVLATAVLHHIGDDEDERPGLVGAAEVMSAFRDAMPSGSALVISHFIADRISAEDEADLRHLYKSEAPLQPRSALQVAAFFEGLELVDPGLVSPGNWRPPAEEGPVTDATADRWMAGGVAVKR